MSGDAEDQPKRKTWTRRIASILVGLVISLIIGAIIERITDKEWLAEAEAAQAGWIDAVAQTSPVGVAAIYWDELSAAWGDGQADSDIFLGVRPKVGLFSPVVAFGFTLARFFYSGGITAIVQIVIGMLAVAVINFVVSDGEHVSFDDLTLNAFFGPLATIAAASLIGMALWAVMMGSLYALSWVTGLAAAAAGATGIAGFCYLCITKLGEKGAEHVMTPKI